MKGTYLAGYEIIDKLGEGGMGEVWRARDEQLGRTVAIKVLPADFSADPARRARFEQEARALAALNHPNIVSVFGAGEHDGRSYIVSELVEGESLRATLERGRLPFCKYLDISIQIADAMAAAHNAGITHRDLKPENIMLTPDGRVKVLDFGLAKRAAPATASKSDPNATATLALSQPGLILGTAGYMSPEQVRGEPVDSRSDIFSFGVVLYELITGKRAFLGNSAIETMHAVLHDDPPEPSVSEPAQSPALATILRRCLEKLPAQRFQSASDLAFALRAISPSNVSAAHLSPATPPVQAKSSRRILWPAVAFLAACALFAAGYFLRDRTVHAEPPTFQRVTFRTGLITNARFAADGRNIVYSAKWEGGAARIYMATPGTPESRDLEFPDDSLVTSVSSKDEIAFLASPFLYDGTGTLSRGYVSGGQMRPALENVGFADWSPDGLSLAVLRVLDGKARIEYPIGTAIWQHTVAPVAFRVSPDGKHLAVAHFHENSNVAISIVDRDDPKHEAKLLSVVSDQNPNRIDPALSWSPDGREVLFRSFDPKEWGTIYAMDMKGHRRVAVRVPGHITLYDVAPDGRLLVRTDDRHEGILGQAPGAPAEVDLSCLDNSILVGISDDGQAIAAAVNGESGGVKGSVYLRKTDGSVPVRLGDGEAWALSPDGKWVSTFYSADAATRRYALLPTGAGEEQVISIPQMKGQANIVFGWRPDGESFLLFGPAKTHGYQNYIWNRKSGALQTIGPEGQGDLLPFVSPDQHRILTRGPDNHWWIYGVGSSEAIQVKGLSEHVYPVGWAADSKSLYVVTHHDENRMLPVSILDIESGALKPWKEIRPARPVENVQNPHITPDGRAYAYNFVVKMSDLYVATLAH